MIVRFAGLLAVFSAGCGLAAAQTGSFQRTFPVSAKPDIYVSTGSGNIHVKPSSGGAVVVIGHIHAGWPHSGDVAERIRRIAADPPLQQSGNELRIGEPADRSLLNQLSIDYEIEAPPEAALNLRTGSGDVVTNGVGRYIEADSGSGGLHVQGTRGPVKLHTGSGDIELNQNGAGEVFAKTGSGSLRLHGIKGPLEAHTGSGDVDASGQIQGPGEVTTGSGSLRVQFAPGDRISLKASTGSGSLHTSLPGFTGDGGDAEDRHNTEGQLNGGGPMLTLRTGSGDIDLRQQ